MGDEYQKFVQGPGSAPHSPASGGPTRAELGRLRQRVAELEATDVSRRRLRAALNASEERYRALYEKIPLMYFTLDVEGIVVEVNAYGAEQLGYRPDELIGDTVLKVFHPEDRQAVSERLESALSDPGRVASWRFRKVRKDGSMLWVREAVRVVEEDGRRIVLVVCDDVTEQVEAEEELARHRDQLRTLNAQLTLAEAREGRRIAEGLHDQTGQSLVAAQMQLVTLLESERDAGKRRALGEVRDLLEQTLSQTRSLTFELSCPVLYRLGLAAALRDLGEGLEHENGIRFRFADDSGTAPLAEDQKVLLYRAARELMLNTVQHARAENLQVWICRADDQLMIEIEDDGAGFAPEELAAGPAAGSGFGLFAIRERLRHLGGLLEIESAPGRGTRALITVPLQARA